MLRAKTLEEAERYFDPRPLDFSEENPKGAKIATNRAFYTPPPEQTEEGRKLPGPIEQIRRRLLSGTSDTKLFLSGHVGSVKEVRLKESMGLYGPDKDALALVHKTNELSSADDRRFLDLSRVIESYNGQPWFDANPLLWPMLKEHSKKNAPRV